MSTPEIIGIIVGAVSIIGVIWGAFWAIGKVVFKLGEYKGHLESSKQETDDKITQLSTTFVAFRKEVNTKLDNISDRLSKVEGKIENTHKK